MPPPELREYRACELLLRYEPCKYTAVALESEYVPCSVPMVARVSCSALVVRKTSPSSVNARVI